MSGAGRTIYGWRPDQLGTCLMNLGGAWRLAEVVGADFVSVWPDDRKLKAGMGLGPILEQIPFTVGERPPVERRLFISSRDTPERRRVLRDGLSDDDLREAFPFLYGASQAIRLACESQAEAEAGRRAKLRSLPFRREIVDAVAAAAAATAIDRRTAVHLRRGDIIWRLRPDNTDEERALYTKWFVGKFIELEAYADAIGADEAVIFSDSPGEAERLAGLLPGGAVTLAAHGEAFAGLTQHQRDMAEMLLMARARRVVTTNSNFGAFAAVYGGIPAVNAIPFSDVDRALAEIVRLFPSDIAGSVRVAFEAAHGRKRRKRLRAEM